MVFIKKKKINESILKELKASIENFNLEKKDFISIILGLFLGALVIFGFNKLNSN